MRIFVGNLPFTTDDQELRGLFEGFGAVESAKVITDRETGRSRGFGFVEMSNENEARAAIEAMANKELGGRNLTVNEARPREANGRGGGRPRKSW
jgi:RNA recognition motif-containing protein